MRTRAVQPLSRRFGCTHVVRFAPSTARRHVRCAAVSTAAPPTAAILATEEDLRAQQYYDSDDAYNFYLSVWGGENIHVGLYTAKAATSLDSDQFETHRETVRVASAASLEKLYELRPPPKGRPRIMDVSSRLEKDVTLLTY